MDVPSTAKYRDFGLYSYVQWRAQSARKKFVYLLTRMSFHIAVILSRTNNREAWSELLAAHDLAPLTDRLKNSFVNQPSIPHVGAVVHPKCSWLKEYEHIMKSWKVPLFVYWGEPGNPLPSDCSWLTPTEEEVSNAISVEPRRDRQTYTGPQGKVMRPATPPREHSAAEARLTNVGPSVTEVSHMDVDPTGPTNTHPSDSDSGSDKEEEFTIVEDPYLYLKNQYEQAQEKENHANVYQRQEYACKRVEHCLCVLPGCRNKVAVYFWSDKPSRNGWKRFCAKRSSYLDIWKRFDAPCFRYCPVRHKINIGYFLDGDSLNNTGYYSLDHQYAHAGLSNESDNEEYADWGERRDFDTARYNGLRSPADFHEDFVLAKACSKTKMASSPRPPLDVLPACQIVDIEDSLREQSVIQENNEVDFSRVTIVSTSSVLLQFSFTNLIILYR